MNKELKVNAIKDGTVFDHIPASQVFRVIDILGLSRCANSITIGMNLDSKLMGKKGIIKVADRFFKNEELDKIALVAPDASVNIIRNYEVTEKKKLSLPASASGFGKCINPMCVTNHEKVETRFDIIKGKDGSVKLRCHWCEKCIDASDLTF